MSLATQIDELELAPIEVDWNLSFTRPATNSGLLYWRSLLAGRAMPERRDLAPRAMAPFLSHVNLVEVCADGPRAWHYLVTLQGRHSREVLGAVQGQRLSEIFPPAVAARWRSCFDLPRSRKMPVRLVTRAGTGGKAHLACEALIAPLGTAAGVCALFWVFAAWREGNIATPKAGLRAGADCAAAAR